MSVTVTVPSAKKASRKKEIVTSRKRRENQNVQIDELASLIPLSSSLVPGQGSSNSLVPTTNGGSKLPIIPVLRLTSSFFKLHDFIKGTSPVKSDTSRCVSDNSFLGRIEEAIDGFLIILDGEANILYVSETIAGYVGLLQQDVIGQNLTDITHPECSSEILDSLKPSLILFSSSVDDCVISLHREFRVKFKPSVSYSTFPSHSTVQIRGNLKVRLTSVKSDVNDGTKCAKPSVVGFVGECRIVESILEISVPTSFTVIRSADMKRTISVESSVKYVIGYDPEMLIKEGVRIIDFLHPTDQRKIFSKRKQVLQTGHAVTPHARLLTSSGDWVWMRAELTRRYKSGTSIPQFWENKITVLSRCGDKLNVFEQTKLYASELNKEQGLHVIVPGLNRMSNYLRSKEGSKPSPDYIKKTMPPESLCHHRPMGRSGVSQAIPDNTTNEMPSVQDAQLLSTSGGVSCSLSSSTPSGCLGSDIASPSHSTSSQPSPVSQSLSLADSPSTIPLVLSHPPVCCDGNGSDNMFKMLWTSEFVPRSLYGEQLQQQRPSFVPATTTSLESVVQNSTQNVTSFGESSPVGSSNSTCAPQEDFDPNQFLTSNNSFTLSSPPEMYIPNNCSNSTIGANLTEMDTLLTTSVNTNSIPSGSSLLFPDSRTPDFVSQPIQNMFSLQIPPSFNFSDSSNLIHSSNFQSPEFYPNLLTVNPEDEVMQQILNDMSGDSINSDSIPDVSLSTDLSIPFHSYSQSDFNVQNANLAHSAAITHSQTQSNSVANDLVSQPPNSVDSQSSIYSCSALTNLIV